ncbi:helix-hairpin-helix domain-containing protein [Mucilaginibacter roseus]|uniref:Helix-hairpin-helix domain-containing protein n=1 Tax=Mucilaginibacter roseus TaxID=1528868 RepID=A0ABS8U276_9SPHI|nr:helix-hairpin-helix domain-containing protein [Mucilaginibacter roseus]MCD8740195.1 helix-hairpin-helix domain-containing protein [Mucilaginibacter roseus]
MENKPIARTLRLLSQLMELHEENSFKIRSVANASFKVDKLPFKVADKTPAELEAVEGIGKSMAGKITELLQTGTMKELQALIEKTPEGVMEMMGIKGIGPKKVGIIWREMGIENTGELLYACNENRLIELKGFGAKTQAEIIKAIEFRMASNGKFLYAQVEQEALEFFDQIKSIFPEALKHIAGEFRRYSEIITELNIVIGTNDAHVALATLEQSNLLNSIKVIDNHVTGELENGLMVDIVCINKDEYYKTLFLNTGSDEHVDAVLRRLPEPLLQPVSEEMIYKKAGLQWIQPELRESDAYIEKAAQDNLPKLITFADLNGSLHNHSVWSDGVHTVEEMALYCRDEMKLEYLGMCDHSRTAVYAKGLSIERVLQQHEEIDHLNKKLNGFHVFKGIESDILSDGSLDYPEEILQKFDFIVTSIHANLKMDIDKATTRLIKAIENPYTTILGHPTGRLLLSRNGYQIDHKKVIDACAANKVVIEINANPLRLDLDWRWQQYALDKGVWLSINPDAHRKEGHNDMQFGVYAARKGGLYKERCLNALSLQQIQEFFKQKRA